MQCKEIIKYLEQWAPKGVAWERDNVGLQIGNPESIIKNIMLSVDLTDKVIEQARTKNCNLIITHHPVFFHHLKRLNFSNDKISMQVEKVVKNNINIYSAHTNLDFTKEGVSFQLAKKLQLNNIRFLKNLSTNQVKLAVFVPGSHINKVAEAIHSAGGGIIGEYSHCGFRTKGMGTFKGSDKSNPAFGVSGELETVEEIKLEVVVDEWKINEVINAMNTAHPYEEVAYDLIVLKNDNVNYGIGAGGELSEPISVKEFLSLVSSRLQTNNLRYTNSKKNKIKSVAVCGGSCSELLGEVTYKNFDAFVTADIKYHEFGYADGKILLVDAGHYETELPVMDEVKKRLNSLFGNDKKNKVYKYKGTTNPIIFYNK